MSSHVSTDNDLAACGFSCVTGWCDDCVGWGRSGEDEDRYEHDLELVSSFAKEHTAYEHVETFFYAHSIGDCDKQNIWNLELALLLLKHKASINSYQLEIPLGRSDLHAGINVIFYLYIICRCKWKIYNLHFSFLSCVCDTFSALPQPSFSCIYHSFHDP